MLPAGTVLDGELVVWGDGALDFGELQRQLASRGATRRVGSRPPATFMAFDVLQSDGVDRRAHILRDRRHVLKELLADVRPPIQLVPQTAGVDEARDWLERYTAAQVGIEGLCAWHALACCSTTSSARHMRGKGRRQNCRESLVQP
ncbi:hypothetical protein ASF05_04415 [Aeromicrobium sp. Leaf245]|jgi:ATP-dependent DNA ligase|nr:hypothetical protein ASF05_04415 [Aeromicrobium sp. Leaf245]KQP82374.1 hypothetical protein ASF35_13235 [Aeromicrobium sp. Leaf291]